MHSQRRTLGILLRGTLLLAALVAPLTPTAAQAVHCQDCSNSEDSSGGDVAPTRPSGTPVSLAGMSGPPAGTYIAADVRKNLREVDGDVDSDVVLHNGDWVQYSASGRIWAGVWFTGKNGPEGWPGWSANNDSPLPGAAPFSVLGKTNADGYFFIGAHAQRPYQNCTSGPGKDSVHLRINDDTPGNGSGAFTVRMIVYRPTTPPACP